MTGQERSCGAGIEGSRAIASLFRGLIRGRSPGYAEPWARSGRELAAAAGVIATTGAVVASFVSASASTLSRSFVACW